MNRQGFIDGFMYKLAQQQAQVQSQPQPKTQSGAAQTKPLSYRDFQTKFDRTWRGGPAGSHDDAAYQLAIREAYRKYLASFNQPRSAPTPPVYTPGTNTTYATKGPSASSLIDIGNVLNSLSDPDTGSRIASTK